MMNETSITTTGTKEHFLRIGGEPKKAPVPGPPSRLDSVRTVELRRIFGRNETHEGVNGRRG